MKIGNRIYDFVMWRIWGFEHRQELKKISEYETEGHTRHCACRQVWGDGECECNLYVRGYESLK